MRLTEQVKVSLRVTSDMLAPEVDALVAAAKADMKRVGVPDSMLSEDETDPLVAAAVTLYCKSRFGYDNSEASRFEKSYRQCVVDLLNSPSLKDKAAGDGA